MQVVQPLTLFQSFPNLNDCLTILSALRNIWSLEVPVSHWKLLYTYYLLCWNLNSKPLIHAILPIGSCS